MFSVHICFLLFSFISEKHKEQKEKEENKNDLECTSVLSDENKVPVTREGGT